MKLPSLKLTAKAPENRPGPNRKVVFQSHPFSEAMLVSGMVPYQPLFGHQHFDLDSYHLGSIRCFQDMARGLLNVHSWGTFSKMKVPSCFSNLLGKPPIWGKHFCESS